MNVQFPPVRNFPSGPLLDSFNIILESISPERKEELEPIVQNTNLIILDSDEWRCDASKDWETIFISRKAIEIVWAFCYAYFDIYSTCIGGENATGQVITLMDKPELSNARRLLTWAINNLSAKEKTEIPDGLPRPDDMIEFASTGHVAIELMFATFGFYLHHELAHLRLKGHSFADLISEERECDRLAVEWILNKCPNNCFDKRAFGIATGLSLMNVFGIHVKNFDGNTHPLSYDRLVDNLESNVDKDNDNVWGWIVAILSIHFYENKIEQPKIMFDNFHDCVVEYRRILDRINKPTVVGL